MVTRCPLYQRCHVYPCVIGNVIYFYNNSNHCSHVNVTFRTFLDHVAELVVGTAEVLLV